MNKPTFEQHLADELAKLSRDKIPERDLWLGIEFALNQKDAKQHSELRQGRRTYLAAAAVVMFGLIGWLSLNQYSSALNGDELVALLSSQHEQQKATLLVKFDGQVALTENWQQQLSELDNAAEAIKKALKNEPNNMALLKMLQNVHQQQIHLIERVHSAKWSQI